MPRLADPLVYDLAEVARLLRDTAGRANLRRAAFRRSVSTAYYAVFHALCFVCASGLVGWSHSKELEPIYRSIEHGQARNRLGRAAKQNPKLRLLETAFAWLQDERYAADYAPPGLMKISRGKAENAVTYAEQAIALIEALDDGERRRLAILLIAKRIDYSLS